MQANVLIFEAGNAPCPANFYMLGVVPFEALQLYTKLCGLIACPRIGSVLIIFGAVPRRR